MEYPTKETHPHLFGGTSQSNLSEWICWMRDTKFMPFETFKEEGKDALAELKIDCKIFTCSYLLNPKSMVRRQMPMAMDFLLLSEEDQKIVLKAGLSFPVRS